jgi:predicted Fe-Mo cluster-binding NifX family protein
VQQASEGSKADLSQGSTQYNLVYGHRQGGILCGFGRGFGFGSGRHLGDKNSIFFEVSIMKVAIAKEGEMVSEHFGHCTEYAVFVIEKSKITSREILESPGHEPGKLPPFLASHKVTHVLAGGMGPRAVDLFCENNIEVFLGVRGKIETVIKDFLAGKIAQGESSCTHGPDHECSGH